MQKRWIWPFELEEQIGSGAMGVVFRARYAKDNRRVALKLLPEEITNPTFVTRFEREMQILKGLRHPNIVRCFGGVAQGAQRFYAMELVDGGTIQSLLRERIKLPWQEVVEYGKQVCAALSCAHAAGIVHRDLKPGNLLMTAQGTVKLGDFGLALAANEQRLTAAGRTLGTLQYMSPEQIQGGELTPAVDLYALGCVMFEMLTGRTPYSGETVVEIMQKHVTAPIPRAAAEALDCPKSLDDLIRELLSKKPGQRPPDAETVGRRLAMIAINEFVQVIPSSEDKQRQQRRQMMASHADARLPWLVRSANGSDPWLPARTGQRVVFGTAVLVALLVGAVAGIAGWSTWRGPTPAEKKWLDATVTGTTELQLKAIDVLAESRCPGAREALIRLLDAPSVEVRRAAVSSLGQWREAAQTANATLTRMETSDPDPVLRGMAQALRSAAGEPPQAWIGWAWRLGGWSALALAVIVAWRWWRSAASED